jgi:hypothetical protein
MTLTERRRTWSVITAAEAFEHGQWKLLAQAEELQQVKLAVAA